VLAVLPQADPPATAQPGLLQPMLQYGLHLGQQAEMLTDSLRALYLEACGYETKVFEFISLEHTNKNKMILAVKRASRWQRGVAGEDCPAQGVLWGAGALPGDVVAGGWVDLPGAHDIGRHS
jgi:hypothetical protein